MKKLFNKAFKAHNRLIIQTILITACVFVLGIGLSFAQTLHLPSDWQEITTNAYENWYDDLSNNEKAAKLNRLQNKIAGYLDQAGEDNQNLITFLAFIDDLADEDIASLQSGNDDDDDADDDSADDNEDETQVLVGLDRSKYQENDKFLLAGSERQIMGGFEITAKNEPITIETLEIQATQDIGNYVETWYIINEDAEIITQKSGQSVGSTVTFRSVDHFVSQNNNQDFYVVADLLPIGYNTYAKEGVSFTFELEVTEAEGYYSGETISKTGISSDEITIAPMQLFIKKLSSAYGRNVDTSLTPGENVVLIFEITAEGGENQQVDSPRDTTMLLQHITATVQDNTAGGDAATNLTLERIDTVSNEVAPSSISGDEATFDSLPSKLGEIEAGQTHTYMLTTDVTLGTQSGENLRVSLENLTNGGITWKEETGSTVYETNATQTHTIQGNKLVE